jgi:hypothetical protein
MKTILLSYVTMVVLATTVASLPAETIVSAMTNFQAVGVSAASQRVEAREAIRVVKDAAVEEFDEPTFARLKGVSFRNGTIAVKVRSKLLPDAPEFARGFIGVAFRINEDNSEFECLYVRPGNARVENQLRRNRTTQYFSFPDFKFDYLRKEAPGEYESYADMGLDEWIDLKIEVKGEQAKLFINGNHQPALVVTDLKHGSETTGAIGLWVDVGTEGYFSDLRISHD